MSPSTTSMRRFAGGLQLHTTDLDDIKLDDAGKPSKRPAPAPPLPHAAPVSLVAYPHSPANVPASRGPVPMPSAASWMMPSPPAWVHTPPPLPPSPPPPHPLPPTTINTLHPLATHLEERMGSHGYLPGVPVDSLNDWEMQKYKERSFSPASSHSSEQTGLSSPKVGYVWNIFCVCGTITPTTNRSYQVNNIFHCDFCFAWCFQHFSAWCLQHFFKKIQINSNPAFKTYIFSLFVQWDRCLSCNVDIFLLDVCLFQCIYISVFSPWLCSKWLVDSVCFVLFWGGWNGEISFWLYEK